MIPAKTLLMVAMVGACLTFGAACNKQQDAETPAEVEPKRPPTPSGTMGLRGEYSRSGDTGMFRDCATGERWRVAHEGNDDVLDRAYVASGVPLGTPLVVTVEGGIDYRPSPDGSKELMFIVARFVQVGPGNTCSSETQ